MSTDCWTCETTPRKHPSPFLEMARAVKNAVKAHGEHLERRRRIRADKKLLMSMPDYMLKDIGIRRSEIDFALNHGREIDRARAIGRLPG